MAYTDTPKQTKIITLTNATPNISKKVLDKCAELGHPVSKKILNSIGAVQAVAEALHTTEAKARVLPISKEDVGFLRQFADAENKDYAELKRKMHKPGSAPFNKVGANETSYSRSGSVYVPYRKPNIDTKQFDQIIKGPLKNG